MLLLLVKTFYFFVYDLELPLVLALHLQTVLIEQVLLNKNRVLHQLDQLLVLLIVTLAVCEQSNLQSQTLVVIHVGLLSQSPGHQLVQFLALGPAKQARVFDQQLVQSLFLVSQICSQVLYLGKVLLLLDTEAVFGNLLKNGLYVDI